MYAPLRTALSAGLFVLLCSNNASAQPHKGTTSVAQGVIYHCPNNHTVDVFGDEDAPINLSASVDRKAALPGMGQFYTESIKYTTLVFGNQADKNGVIISQTEAQRAKNHTVSIAYIQNGVEVWSYASCHGE